MDQISDEKKPEWLATAIAPTKRAMINTADAKDSWHVPNYTVTPLQSQTDRSSLGYLDKLPPELLHMVFRHLTCGDLEAIHSCSTGGRVAVLSFPPYHRLLEHVPAILAILKETGLARSFTIMIIYETFASTLCTNCGEFGGYVFLVSFTRCCLHCAETELKFMPVSHDSAKKELGVEGKEILDPLPQLNTIEGYYSSYGKIKYREHRRILFSREAIEKLIYPEHRSALLQLRQIFIRKVTIKAPQRYMALTPLPCFISASASIEKGVYCVGCAIRAKEHLPCGNPPFSDQHLGVASRITDGRDVCCGKRVYHNNFKLCPLGIARDRMHDSRHILGHLEGCEGAQAVLKMKWTQLQMQITEMDI